MDLLALASGPLSRHKIFGLQLVHINPAGYAITDEMQLADRGRGLGLFWFAKESDFNLADAKKSRMFYCNVEIHPALLVTRNYL